MNLEFFILVLSLICVKSYEEPSKLKQLENKFLPVNEMESNADFWKEKAQNYLTSKLNSKLNTNKAKNIIMFLGDGMGLSTVSATRLYLGRGENQLSFESFPYFGLSKTYCVDRQTADSACSATSYLNGVKSNFLTIGVNANVKAWQCEVDAKDFTESLGVWAAKSGKSVGIVTTTRVTHASPSGVYAHIAHRDWEHNNMIPIECRNIKNVTDIAHQLVYNNFTNKIKVILGGGRRNFINTTENDDEGVPGLRTDGRNLINEWVTERSKKGTAKYLWHKQQLDEIDFEKTDYLMGLFESNHCMFNLDIENNNLQHQEPSLTDMTVAAIKMLEKDKNGYFLFVEGGRIDHAHHDSLIKKALEDTKEFAKAIEVTTQMTSLSDTLIVVTSDHSHPLTHSGDSERGHKVLEPAGVSDEDGKAYETLSYANGPGYSTAYDGVSLRRADISEQDFENPLRKSSTTVPMDFDTHGAEDVGVYASGPWAHLFSGNYEQNAIPVLMAYAAKIGPYKSTTQPTATDSAGSLSLSVLLCSIILFVTARSVIKVKFI